MTCEQVGHPTCASIRDLALKLRRLQICMRRMLYAVHEPQRLGKQKTQDEREQAHWANSLAGPIRCLADSYDVHLCKFTDSSRGFI